MPKEASEPEQQSLIDGRTRALVFISHDTRDAEVAEAFSKLLSSVSAGVLKSFRSSDKRGNQGIEYGVEWYPEIMRRLQDATDVVCLLTENSTNRPWILYEAGVAKGRLNTPVHGIAIGVPMSTASTGPFAQFQNCDDDEDSLTRLVTQLVGRIPNAEPDQDIIRAQVLSFKERVKPLLAQPKPHKKAAEPEPDTSAVLRAFEEVKLMFFDLPSRIDKRPDQEIAAAVHALRARVDAIDARVSSPEQLLPRSYFRLVSKDFNLRTRGLRTIVRETQEFMRDLASEGFLSDGDPKQEHMKKRMSFILHMIQREFEEHENDGTVTRPSSL